MSPIPAITPGPQPAILELRWPIPVNAAASQIGDTPMGWDRCMLPVLGSAISTTVGDALNPAAWSHGFVGGTSSRILSAGGPTGPLMEFIAPFPAGMLFGLPWAPPTGTSAIAVPTTGPVTMRIDAILAMTPTALSEGFGLVWSNLLGTATVLDPAEVGGLGGITVRSVAAGPPVEWEVRSFLAGGVVSNVVPIDTGNLTSIRLRFDLEPGTGDRPEVIVSAGAPTMAEVATFVFDGVDLPVNGGDPWALALWQLARSVNVSTRGTVRVSFPV